MSEDNSVQNKPDTLTPEVKMDSKTLYLIRINGEEAAFADSVNEAVNIVDSIAAANQENLKGEWVKVYREDLNEGQKVVISTQELGTIYNGNICEAFVIDYVAVRRAFLIKGRREFQEEEKVIPVPEILQKLAQANVQEDESSDEEEEDTIEVVCNNPDCPGDSDDEE